MSLDIQYKIINNINYKNYLRTHSYWYKYLNRNPNIFKKFEEEVKNTYKLTMTHRIEKITDTIDFVSKLMSSLGN